MLCVGSYACEQDAMHIRRTTVTESGLGWAVGSSQLQELDEALHNMHHLISTLRPHQARAALEEQLQEQIEAKQEALRELREKTAAALAEVAAMSDEVGGGVGAAAGEAGKAQEAYRATQGGGALDGTSDTAMEDV